MARRCSAVATARCQPRPATQCICREARVVLLLGDRPAPPPRIWCSRRRIVRRGPRRRPAGRYTSQCPGDAEPAARRSDVALRGPARARAGERRSRSWSRPTSSAAGVDALAGSLIRLRRDHPDAIREIYLNSPLRPTPACPPNRRDIDRRRLLAGRDRRRRPAAGKVLGSTTTTCPAAFRSSASRRPRCGAGSPTSGSDTGRVLADQASGRPRAEIDRDVALRDSLHLDSTPSIVINGYPKPGGICRGRYARSSG